MKYLLLSAYILLFAGSASAIRIGSFVNNTDAPVDIWLKSERPAQHPYFTHPSYQKRTIEPGAEVRDLNAPGSAMLAYKRKSVDALSVLDDQIYTSIILTQNGELDKVLLN